jgi:hypothetical protein
MEYSRNSNFQCIFYLKSKKLIKEHSKSKKVLNKRKIKRKKKQKDLKFEKT